MPRNFSAQISAAIAAFVCSAIAIGASVVPATQNAVALIV